MRQIPTLAGVFCLSLVSAFAQFGPMGGMGRGSQMTGVITKLFGKEAAFTANVEMETSAGPGGQPMTLSSKMIYCETKTRFEVDLSSMKGGGLPPEAIAQMTSMGMDKMVVISRPDKKTTYLIYPSLKSYVDTPIPDESTNECKIETTDLGKETVDGHACVKQKAIVTESDGKKHEATLWKATDLKDIPIKIEQVESAAKVTMTFKNVSLAKPAESLFAPPTEGTRYDNVMALMQGAMQKAMGGVPAGLPGSATAPQGQPRRPEQ